MQHNNKVNTEKQDLNLKLYLNLVFYITTIPGTNNN